LAIVAIIPARYGSTRLPGKPLSDIHGKPMVQHVHERVRLARSVERVLVATDDERIVRAVQGFGGEAVRTSPDHASGTDRVAEVARGIEAELVVNVQGDEPMLDPAWIDAAVAALRADAGLPIATLSLPLAGAHELADPSVVKVVVDGRDEALYFSRSAIPYVRLAEADPRRAADVVVEQGLARRHVGLYAYRRDALARLAALPPSPLERAEGLEQLRALQDGMRIRVVERQGSPGVAVDTPADLERVRELLAELAREA
jgi:3-deoxy-manno-octulosonate cytidylyltransferase (CMP-KDO synthetase)